MTIETVSILSVCDLSLPLSTPRQQSSLLNIALPSRHLTPLESPLLALLLASEYNLLRLSCVMYVFSVILIFKNFIHKAIHGSIRL